MSDGALRVWAVWGWVASAPYSHTVVWGWLPQPNVLFNFNSAPCLHFDWLTSHSYFEYVTERMCACFSVCCELSLTPNSLSLIGCVILGKDKEGHWREAWGGGNQGNERALPITAWPVASLPYKETLILTLPATPLLLTLLHSSPHVRHHPLKPKTTTFSWSEAITWFQCSKG